MAQQQRRRSALSRGEREAPAYGEFDALGLGQHRRERAAAEPLLHRPGHVPLAAGAEDQQVRRLQAEIAPARAVEAAEAGGPTPALADQHSPALAGALTAAHPPRQQRREKGGGSRPVRSARTRGLVQAVRREAPLRQGTVQSASTPSDQGRPARLPPAAPSSAGGRRSSAAMRRRSASRSDCMAEGATALPAPPACWRVTRSGGMGWEALMVVHYLFFCRACQATRH